MSQELKREYLRAIRERYQKSPRVRKSMILEEFVSVCGYSRKYAIRILNGQHDPSDRKCRGRVTKYSPEIVYHLVRLWDAMGRPCSIRFKAAAPEWIEFDPDPILRENGTYRALVLGVSRSHLDRLLRPYRTSSKGPSLTRQGLRSIRNSIPIEPKDWNVTAPGSVQSDTVAHCGDRLEGGFANTLTVTDIHTTWTETRGIWGKGAIRVIKAMREIEDALPFSITTFKSDSGSEFMNHDLHQYFLTRENAPVKMTRSRPYKKNDNCYVEQKNFTHVREIFGYDRISQPDLVSLMNEIYAEYWCPLQNFFVPSMKLLRKTRIGARIKKEYDRPITPFQRLMECSEIAEEKKQELRKKKAQLNPFLLQEGLEKKLRAFQELLRQRNTGRLQVA
jgi:hypothetical protein